MSLQCNTKIVEELKKKYPKGTRIKLLKMDDFQAPTPGSQGTVRGVDDCGHILMSWDEGGSLSLIENVDNFIIVE